jgi:hypothetical protein
VGAGVAGALAAPAHTPAAAATALGARARTPAGASAVDPLAVTEAGRSVPEASGDRSVAAVDMAGACTAELTAGGRTAADLAGVIARITIRGVFRLDLGPGSEGRVTPTTLTFTIILVIITAMIPVTHTSSLATLTGIPATLTGIPATRTVIPVTRTAIPVTITTRLIFTVQGSALPPAEQSYVDTWEDADRSWATGDGTASESDTSSGERVL